MAVLMPSFLVPLKVVWPLLLPPAPPQAAVTSSATSAGPAQRAWLRMVAIN